MCILTLFYFWRPKQQACSVDLLCRSQLLSLTRSAHAATDAAREWCRFASNAIPVVASDGGVFDYASDNARSSIWFRVLNA
jgi:hypothetical protein